MDQSAGVASDVVGDVVARDLDPAPPPRPAVQQFAPDRDSNVADEVGVPMFGGPTQRGHVLKGLAVETASITSRGALYEYVGTIPDDVIAACIQATKINEDIVPDYSSGLKRRG